jgi:psiF repeat
MRLMPSVVLLSVAIGMGTAWAQTSAPSPTSQDQKKAISKSCTDQANAKGLHGKERRKFRSECKKAGGKSQ